MILNDSSWKRLNTFDTNVVLLDGLTGTGKTMIMRILDTYSSVTPPKFNYQLEQILIGINIGEIGKDFGMQLLQLLLDQIQYDLAIGREINLRPRDLSSVLSSTKRFVYLSNLLKSDGSSVKERILKKNQDLLLVTHQLLDAATTINCIPGKTLTHILCVRHPYFLVAHWESYIPMQGKSPTDFQLINGITPWFIKEFKDVYASLNTKERAMCSIIEATNKSLDFIEQGTSNLLVFDFEKFVLNPNRYLELLSEALPSPDNRRLKKVLRAEKLPRSHISDSVVRAIYKRYGSETLSTKHQHNEDYKIMRERSKLDVDLGIYNAFEVMAKRYESMFGLWF